jgi:hypothetical protein
MLRLLAAAAIPVVMAAAGAQAAPPEGADPDSPTGQWFQSLMRLDGMSCCSVSDCRPAAPDELRSSDAAGLEVRLESAWVEVPEYKIVRRDDNPLGKSIICRNRAEVYCVIPYTGL